MFRKNHLAKEHQERLQVTNQLKKLRQELTIANPYDSEYIAMLEDDVRKLRIGDDKCQKNSR